MLFLLNDVILTLDSVDDREGLAGARLEGLSLNVVTRMGQELFAVEPQLQKTNPERAKRLATLLIAAEPSINAALYLAPQLNCRPDKVTARYADTGLAALAQLYNFQKQGQSITVQAHQMVWQAKAA
jgi:hypothetical protein